MLASSLKNKGKLSMLRHVKFIYPNLNIGKIVNLSFYKQLYPKHFLSVVYFLNIFLFKYNLNIIIIYFVEVIRYLEMNKRYDAIPTNNEWRNIEDIANCLTSIKTATEILSRIEYPTVNLALLFRSVIYL